MENKFNISSKSTINTTKNINIKHIVAVTSSGHTDNLFIDTEYISIICVNQSSDFSNLGKNEAMDDIMKYIISKGFKVFTTSYVLSGDEQGVKKSIETAVMV